MERITQTAEDNADKKLSKRTKFILAGIPAALVLAYLFSDQIAELFVDEPDAPVSPIKPDAPAQPKLEAPESPVRITAERPNVEIAMAIDNSRSEIKAQLPDVKRAVIEFLRNQRGVLRDGDAVDICTFTERVNCFRFSIPDQFNDLIEAINAVEVVPTRGLKTNVAVSIGQVIEFLRGSENAFVTAWTDAKEEGETPDKKTPVPVNLVIPDGKYLEYAEQVEQAMEGVSSCSGTECQGVDVFVAKSGAEFGALLKRFTDALQTEAQRVADLKADADFADAKVIYEKKLQEAKAAREKYEADLLQWKKDIETQAQAYKDALDKYATEKAGLQKTVDNVKQIIDITLIALGILIVAAISTLVALERRPRFRGFIQKSDGDLPYPLPRKKQGKHRIDLGEGRYVVVKPSSLGLILKESGEAGEVRKEEKTKIIGDGREIIPGFFYYSKLPKRDFRQDTTGSGNTGKPANDKDKYRWD